VSSRQRGQVLPLFALMLVALFAIAGLAIDVSSGYSARQAYRTASDAASLAGAQDLQTTGSRAVTGTDRTKARTDALNSLKQTFNATTTGAGTCNPAANIANCELTGTPFVVSIRTPVTACVSCDLDRSVQVTVTNPQFSLSFSRVIGIDHWNVGTSSVAGLFFSGQYALITLRPPDGIDTGNALADVEVNGSTTLLKIDGGDIGSNRSVVSSGTVGLDPGYSIYHYDAPTPWDTTPPIVPPERRLTSLIQDPKYPYPSSTGAPATYSTLASAKDTAANCLTIVTTRLITDPGYRNFVPGFPSAPDMSEINCYRQGIYDVELTDRNDELTVLEPGLYFFRQGISLQSNLVGGYQPNSPGVALVFPRDEEFKNNNTGLVALNAGTRFGNASGGIEAAPARAYDGSPVVTNTTPGVLMTVMVEWDDRCTVTQPYPRPCRDTQNDAIKLNSSSLYLAGVQYAPSDNAAIAGGSAGVGYVGQIVAWTVKYSGGSTLNQEFLGNVASGVIRLDGACTAPGTPCSP
jgi:Flp pilus assembly protein TadG